MHHRSKYHIEALEARRLLADPPVALVWPITPENRLDLGQDYAQRNWGNAAKHHTGIDIAAAEGTIVRAAGGGIVRRVVMTPGVHGGDNNCMGNVVIIDHSFGESPDGPFTLYGQLQAIDIANGVRVFSGQPIGKVGRTPTVSRPGCTAPAAPALHFEFKQRGVLGNQTDNGPEVRYTPNHPDQYGYFDPLAALTVASTVEPQNATPIPPTRVTASIAVNIRSGPGNYRVLRSSAFGETFTAIRESPPTTTSPVCPQGWYQVRSTSGSYFADPARAGSTIPDGWMCKGTTAEVWLTPDAAAPDVTGVNPLKPRALGTAQPLVINGANFSAAATVNLYDVTHGVSYLNRTVGSRAGTTQIVINPNFGSSAATWRVEVVNTDGRKDSFTFNVIVEAKKAVPKPAMQWVTSPYFSSRGGTTVDSVVIHTVEGSYQSAINLFAGPNNPNSVSAHFVISPAGEITQMVELSNRAHHGTYYNSRSIGIEMAGFAHQASTWTPQNMAALEKVVAWVVSQYPIAVIHPPADARDYAGCRYNAAGLVSHMQVQPDSCTTFAIKTDPGPYFDWHRFVTGVEDRVYTRPGDANRDGAINLKDYLRIDRGIARGRTGFGNGDFNFDDAINGADYFIIDQAYLAERATAGRQVSAAAGNQGTTNWQLPSGTPGARDEDNQHGVLDSRRAENILT